jgi:peptidylprolyl isomerase
MAEAAVGDTVQVHYTGKLEDGTEFGTSRGQEPLQFKVGENTILPKLEMSVVGMAIGDTASVEIAAADGYGPRQPEAIETVDRSALPTEVELVVGNQLQAQTQDGHTLVVTIIAVDGASVTLDGNHPLAGEDLTFEIELVEIAAGAG